MRLKRELDWCVIIFGVAGLALSILAVDAYMAVAKSARDAKRDAQSRAAGNPVMAIVSLGDQRITNYDTDGKILQAPVSSGSKGYETPAGIYSIVLFIWQLSGACPPLEFALPFRQGIPAFGGVALYLRAPSALRHVHLDSRLGQRSSACQTATGSGCR